LQGSPRLVPCHVDCRSQQDTVHRVVWITSSKVPPNSLMIANRLQSPPETAFHSLPPRPRTLVGGLQTAPPTSDYTLRPGSTSDVATVNSALYPTSRTTSGRSRQFMLKVCFLTFATLVLSIGVGGALLGYLISGQISWDSKEIVTAVPQGNILLISGFASKAVLTSVPVVMSIAAYRVGDMWLNNSKATAGPTKPQQPDLPSPYQYGILLSTF
jgi:hypothetical protein